MKTLNTISSIEETRASRAAAKRILKHLLRISQALEKHANQRGDLSTKSLRNKIKILKVKSQSSSSAALSSKSLHMRNPAGLSKIRRLRKRRRSFKLRWRGGSVSLTKSTLSKRSESSASTNATSDLSMTMTILWKTRAMMTLMNTLVFTMTKTPGIIPLIM